MGVGYIRYPYAQQFRPFYDWAYSVDVPQIDITGLDPFDECEIIFRNLTASIASNRALRASIDGGANFLATNGDYKSIVSAGTESPASSIAVATGSATTALSGIVVVTGLRSVGPKRVWIDNRASSFIIDTISPVNGLRIYPGSGNIQGGTLQARVR